MSTTPIITHQGAIEVNLQTPLEREAKVLSIDLTSKYAEAIAWSGSTPEVHLMAGERTLKTVGDDPKAITVLELPGYEGWELLEAWVGRYTLTVVLVRPLDQANREVQA